MHYAYEWCVVKGLQSALFLHYFPMMIRLKKLVKSNYVWKSCQECQEVWNVRRQPWHRRLWIGIAIHLNSLRKTTDVLRYDIQRWPKVWKCYFWIAHSIALKPVWLRLRSLCSWGNSIEHKHAYCLRSSSSSSSSSSSIRKKRNAGKPERKDYLEISMYMAQ